MLTRSAVGALVTSGAVLLQAMDSHGGGQPLQISEIRVEQFPGVDDATEYFELTGEAGHTLAGYTYIVIGDDVNVIAGGDTNSGVIEAIIPLEGALDSEGRWLVAQTGFPLATPDQVADLNFEDVDNVTHLLVTEFRGELDWDLDGDDDGVLEVQPWTTVIDAVGLLWQPSSPFTGFGYGGSLGFEDLGPNFDNLPQHVYRGSDCGEWVIDYDAADNDADTPGEANLPCPPDPPPFGLAHGALGDAALKAGESGLVISNIGASGDDGFLVSLGAAEGWLGAIDFGPGGGLAAEAQLMMKVVFTSGETPNQARLTIAEVDGGLASMSFDVDSCEPCSLTVEALLDDVVVDSVSYAGEPDEPVALGAIGSSGDEPPILRYSLAKLDDKSGADMAILLRNPAPTPLTLTGSSIGKVAADIVRLRVDGLPSGLLVDNRVEITAASIESLTISDEALLQFHLEHRGLGEALITGEVDADGGPDLVVGNLDPPQTNDGVSIRPPVTELFDTSRSAAPAPHQAVRLETVLPAGEYFSTFDEWLVRGRFENGTESILIATQYFVLGNGEVIFVCLDGNWISAEMTTLTAFLEDEVVAESDQLSLSVPSESAAQFLSFRSLGFELLPSIDSQTGGYRVTFTWDEPVLVEVGQFVTIDELQMELIGTFGSDGEPIEVSETSLFGFAWEDEAIAMRVEDATFLTASEICPEDLTGDGLAGPADLAELLAAWGSCSANCLADLAPPPGGDGVVGPADLAELLASWGPCS